MRPTPGELILAVRDALRTAGAELKTTEAKAAFRRALYVLREGRWDDAAFDLLHENAALADAIRRVCIFLGELPPSEEATLPHNFAEANCRNLALRTTLSGLLDRLDLPTSRGLRTELALLLRGAR